MTFESDLVATLPSLKGYARALTHGHAADDLVQDTAVKALTSRTLYKERDAHEGGSFVAWLRVMMKRLQLDHLKAASRRIQTEPLTDRIVEATTGGDLPDVRLAVRNLERALKRLSPSHRSVLVERLLGAERVDRKQLWRARQALQEKYDA